MRTPGGGGGAPHRNTWHAPHLKMGPTRTRLLTSRDSLRARGWSRRPGRQRTEALKRHVALVFAKEIQKPAVVLRVSVEGAHERLVAAAGSFKSAQHDLTQGLAGQFTRPTLSVRDVPQRLS